MLIASCAGSDDVHEATSGQPLADRFAASANAHDVPRDLLVAIAHVEGGLNLPKIRAVDPSASVTAAGPLQLRHGRFNSLARGAALMQTTELALRQDTDLALEAGARVIEELGLEQHAHADNLASWAPVVERLSGYADEAHRVDYAHRVFALLARGGEFPARDGETIRLAPHDLPLSLTLDISDQVRVRDLAEYPTAEWIPTSCDDKCSIDRFDAQINGETPIDTVVIHDTEGSWDASVATLQNDLNKSVHYIVGTDGRVAQFIPESYTAWHAGNWPYNERSIGIEHVGYWDVPYSPEEYAASAALVRYIAGKYGILRDRRHIIGHDQVPNPNYMPATSDPCEESPRACELVPYYGGSDRHTDPGVWTWCPYMASIGGGCKCNDDETACFSKALETPRARIAPVDASAELVAQFEPGGCDIAQSPVSRGSMVWLILCAATALLVRARACAARRFVAR